MPPIPPTVFLLAYSVTAAACLYWHNRQASRHLLTMAWGMAATTLVALPAVFESWAGHLELARYASIILEPDDGSGSPYGLYSQPIDPATRLLSYCRHLSGVGLAIFAVGLWRFAKDLVLKACYPRPGQA